MSALFFNQLKHLQMRYDALQKAYDDLAERVLQLEAEKPDPAVTELDTDTLEPVKRKPGRPRKAEA